VALGLNYRDHAGELKMKLPEEPLLFLKPGTSVIGRGWNCLSEDVGESDYEAELAVVIAKTAKAVSEEKAPDYILGIRA